MRSPRPATALLSLLFAVTSCTSTDPQQPAGSTSGAPNVSGGTDGSSGTSSSAGVNTGSGGASTGGAAGGASGTVGVAGSANAGSSTGGASGSNAVTAGATTGGASAGAGVGGGAAAGSAGATALPKVTLWLAGDSTVQNYVAGNMEGNGGTELEGWGQEIGQFFTTDLTVNNKAIGGRSVAFYMYAVVRDTAGAYVCVDDQGNPQYQLDTAGNRIDNTQWGQVKAGIQAGDFLLIQFGTNDETHTCPRYVSLPDFETDLGIMADTVRAKGATPIFVTPVSHRSFSGATVNNTLLPYANAMKDEGRIKGVEILDLNLRSVEYFQTAGTTFLATNIFDGGTTHFIRPGAIKMAELIVGEIRKNGGPLAAYLK